VQRPNRIPLFPLDVVLLPAMPLPLHIFEPRYKVMVARCLTESLEFGMLLAANNSMVSVGCTAEITQKTRDYPDGRMDILTSGRAVFRLAELLDEKEYYEGAVEYLADDPPLVDPEKEKQLVSVFEQCHLMLFGRAWMDMPGEAATLAYRMAALLPMDLAKRQALLEMRSERARRDAVLEWLNGFLPRLATQQQALKRASGNGHTLN